jgi:hypothetical protein
LLFRKARMGSACCARAQVFLQRFPEAASYISQIPIESTSVRVRTPVTITEHGNVSEGR